MRYAVVLWGLGATLLLAPVWIHDAYGVTVDELRAQLDQKRSNLNTVKEKIKKFQSDIQQKKQEARTLQDQIVLLDDNIQHTELTIEQTSAEVEEANSEIDNVEADISATEQEITRAKALLTEYLRSLNELDQQSTVTIFLKYQTFSEAMNEAATVQELQDRTHQTLVEIEKLRDELMTKRRELEDYRQTLEALKKRQEDEQKTLVSQKNSKTRILELTNAQESQYKSLLKQAQESQQQAQADISRLDDLIREELRKQGVDKLPSVGTMDWPIEAIFGVSCGFHCSGYPYAYLIGPHTGVDIPTYVGTPIKAPADGYIARTHDSQSSGYSYILMLHGDKVSTVYGHVSGFAVNEGQMVSRGTVIGYTGGAPGSRGSGLSSGPHLHFEVRLNNLPTDPMKYLGSR